MLMVLDVKESSFKESLTDKVRRDTLCMFFFLLPKTLFTFEAKYFDADGVRYEGEYQDNEEGGQKSNIYVLLLYDLFFIKRHYLLLKRSTSLLVERDMQESLKMANTKEKVRRETLFMVYYLGSSYLLSNYIIDF